MSQPTTPSRRPPKRPGIRAVAAHLWRSPVHVAAVDLLDPRSGQHVVDLGAGLGAATLELARRVAPTGTVTAVDPSAIMRAMMTVRRLGHGHRSCISIEPGTAANLPLPTEGTDAVIALNVAHLLPDVDAAGREISRVLGPGGRVLFVEEDLDHPSHAFHHSTPHAPDGPTLDELADALIRAGLTVDGPHGDVLGGQPVNLISAST